MTIIRGAFWTAGIVLVVSILLLTLHFSTDILEFSQYNTGWNGTSLFFSDLDRHHVTLIDDASSLSSSGSPSVLLIISPKRSPLASEISAYRAFLSRGNTIVVVDDFGTGNEILKGIGSSISILPGNLSSVDREYADPYSVVAYGVANSPPFVSAGTTVLLDRPAALSGGKPILTTSVLSWIDANGDKKVNPGETMGNYVVMAVENPGTGNIVVLSDPSIFTNAMYVSSENRNNRELIQNLVRSNTTVLLDQMNSRTSDAEGVTALIQQTRSNLGFKILILLILVLFLMSVWRSRILQVLNGSERH